MPHRLRLTITSLALAAAFLIGSAPACQAATAGHSAASLNAPSWVSALWTAVRVQLAPVAIFNSNNHFGAKRTASKHPVRGLRLLIDGGVGINPNGGG